MTWLTIAQVTEQYSWSRTKVYAMVHLTAWRAFCKQVNANGKRNSGGWRICKEKLDEWILQEG